MDDPNPNPNPTQHPHTARGTLPAFTPVPRAKERSNGWKPQVQRAFIEALAADGHDVIIHYNSSSDEAEALAKELKGVRAIALGADLSQPEEAAGLIKRANQALGPVGVLVNSASVFEQDQLEDVGADSFNRHMTANTLAPDTSSSRPARNSADGLATSARPAPVISKTPISSVGP